MGRLESAATLRNIGRDQRLRIVSRGEGTVDHSVDRGTTADSGRAASSPVSARRRQPMTAASRPNASAFPTGSNSSRPADGRVRAYWVWAVCGFLLLAVGLVFGQTVRHEFIGFDDNGFVYENPHVTPGLTLSGLWWALTDGPFGEWYPLSTLSHMLDCQLYGLNPAGHYLTNVLLHAASSVLLFLVLLRMTGDLWPSAWVAAVFAIHPLHVESVAWVAERRDVLSGLFFMLTLGAYALYAERPSLARYLAVAGCFALGLMAKPMLVTVPFLLLLLDYWPLDRFRHAAGASPTSRIGLVARSLAGRLAAGGGKDSAHGPGGGELRDCPVDPRVDSVDQSGRTIVAGDTPGQCPGFVRSLLGPVFLSRRSGSLLSSSRHPPADGLGCRITGSAGGDHRGRRVLLAPAALSAGRLAVVFGNAGAGHRIGADRRSCPGRPLYLSESDRFVDRAGLGRVERLSVTTISSSAARWRRWMLAVVSGGAVLRLPPWRGVKLPTGAMPRRSGRIRSLAPSRMRWLTIISAIALRQQGRTDEAIAPSPRSVGGRFDRSGN